MQADKAAYKKSSFGPAFLFLDRPRRQALAVYYAFCRLMDDLADEPGIPDPQGQLNFWRAETERAFHGEPQTQLGWDMAQAAQSFGMPQDRFLLLIEGMEADLQGRRYANWQELEWYLYRVAGIVGRATLDILGVKGPKAENLARSLGFAVQITNIVRDVHEDAAAGRVYLPAELLGKHGLTQQDVLQNTRPEKLAQALQDAAEVAKAYYAQAQAVLCTVSWRKALPCRIMGCVYRANLAKIEAAGFVFDKKIKLTRFEKIKNIIYALFNHLS